MFKPLTEFGTRESIAMLGVSGDAHLTSVAGMFALQETGRVLKPESVDAAEDLLASISETHKISPDGIQAILESEEPCLKPTVAWNVYVEQFESE